MIKTGWNSRAFSICKVFKNQADCSVFLRSSTSASTEEFNVCFVDTPFTKKIASAEWPDCVEFLCIRHKNIQITKEIVDKTIEEAIAKASGEPLTMNRAVSVNMLEMGWFFKNKKNFVAFSELLKNLPKKVYGSLLLQAILGSFWEDKQRYIKIYHFTPFCIFVILSVMHFTTMLYDHDDPEIDNDEK